MVLRLYRRERTNQLGDTLLMAIRVNSIPTWLPQLPSFKSSGVCNPTLEE